MRSPERSYRTRLHEAARVRYEYAVVKHSTGQRIGPAIAQAGLARLLQPSPREKSKTEGQENVKGKSAVEHGGENATEAPRRYNHFSANGNNPLNSVSQPWGSFQSPPTFSLELAGEEEFEWGRPGNKDTRQSNDVSGIKNLVNTLIEEGKARGAKQLKVKGYAIVNKNIMRDGKVKIQGLVRAVGGTVRATGPDSLEITIPLK